MEDFPVKPVIVCDHSNIRRISIIAKVHLPSCQGAISIVISLAFNYINDMNISNVSCSCAYNIMITSRGIYIYITSRCEQSLYGVTELKVMILQTYKYQGPSKRPYACVRPYACLRPQPIAVRSGTFLVIG